MTTIESIPLGDQCSVTLHRTLRIPDDGGEYRCRRARDR